MAATVQDIRDRLDALASTQVPDGVITAAIEDSTIFIDSVKTTDAASDLLDLAYKRYATYLSYLSYAEGISMQRGGLPEITKIKLDELRVVAEIMINKVATEPVSLSVVASGELQLGLPPIAGESESSAYIE